MEFLLSHIYPILYIITACGALLAGYIVYSALTTSAERIQARFRWRRKWMERSEEYKTRLKQSRFERRIKRAGYPFGINAVRYQSLFTLVMVTVTVYYIIWPMVLGQTPTYWQLGIVFIFFMIGNPAFSFSLVSFGLKKIGDYKDAKRMTEIFNLYDLIVSDVEMMEHHRINTYNLIRDVEPYFDMIRPDIQRLLSRWMELGSDRALDLFSDEMDRSEVRSLVNVLKRLDENDRQTALKSLDGMNAMFMNAQIEERRRQHKFMVDIGNFPVMAAVYATILNFILIVVVMALQYLNDAMI